MGVVILDIWMSLDGFIAGQHDRADNPLGDNGMLLHKWAWGDKTDGRPGEGAKGSNRKIIDELSETTGAVVVGHRTYEIVHGWGGSHPIHGVPAFVICRHIPENVPQGATKFTFVTAGVESAIQQAKAAAGEKMSMSLAVPMSHNNA
jgi:dihydrofolate reductase